MRACWTTQYPVDIDKITVDFARSINACNRHQMELNQLRTNWINQSPRNWAKNLDVPLQWITHTSYHIGLPEQLFGKSMESIRHPRNWRKCSSIYCKIQTKHSKSLSKVRFNAVWSELNSFASPSARKVKINAQLRALHMLLQDIVRHCIKQRLSSVECVFHH